MVALALEPHIFLCQILPDDVGEDVAHACAHALQGVGSDLSEQQIRVGTDIVPDGFVVGHGSKEVDHATLDPLLLSGRDGQLGFAWGIDQFAGLVHGIQPD